MARARGIPFAVSRDGTRYPLERLQLGSGNHSEAWLQELIHQQPEILPIGQLEPGFGTLVPIACEVPCGHGYIDNLLITPGGDIVIVEAKLWANPQARREVVAQALDYVAALAGMGYDTFEAAVARATNSCPSIYSCMADHPEVLSEAEFVDTVSANLARGRMLVLVVGDGIRREAEALGDLLQGHAGAHFTFALVELAIWHHPASGDILVIPDALARTVMIERGIVRLADGAMQVQLAPVRQAARASTISEELYFEELAKRDPAMPGQLRAFIERIEPLGVYVDLKASLNLKADLPELNKPMNFGYITKTGKVWTDPMSRLASADIAEHYNLALAEAIGGSVARMPDGNFYLSTNGRSAPRLSDLLPGQAEAHCT